MKKYYLYNLIILFYLIICLFFIHYLLNFDCDGLACLSVVFFSLPLIVLFTIIFGTIFYKSISVILINDELKEEEKKKKLKVFMKWSMIPFILFSLYLILRFLIL